MSQKNWREILKEIEEANPQDDSLELGDSWRGMPRRTEGIANKTNGLYRRSALPPVPVKNIYNIIIEKQPKSTVHRQTNSNSTNETAPTQSQKTLIPSVIPIPSADADDVDTLDFSLFLRGKKNDRETVTSTPFPLRQIDVNKSPKSITGDVQRRAADSPKKNKLLVPVPIVISTPRTSRIPSDPERYVSHQQGSRSNKDRMSSAVVSSTVADTSSDDGEVLSDAAKCPVETPALLVQTDRTTHTTENAVQNCLSFDEDQQEQDACTKPSDEAIFRRPQMVRQPSQKQNKLDPENETTDQPELSNNSQRSKKSKQKVDILLENYKKVGESIINKTNVVASGNSTSSSRRKLYKKGDSCNEDQIVSQQICDVVTSAYTNGTFSKTTQQSVQSNAGESDVPSDTTRRDGNADVPIPPPKTTIDFQPNGILPNIAPVSEQENLVDLTDCGDSDGLETQDESSESSHKTKESLNRVQSHHASSSGRDKEKDRSKTNGIGQLNDMSEKHSSKQVLVEILEDWPDTSDKQDNSEDFRSDSSDSEKKIQKQPPKEARVRQDRSRNEIVEKPIRGRPARAETQRIAEKVASEEDELSDLSDSEQKIQKQLPKVARVRQDRAKNAKNETVEKPSSKPIRGRPARAETQRVAEKVASEEDEPSDLSDSEQKIQKQLPKVARVRQDRAKNAKNEIVEKPSSKPIRGRTARAETQRIAEKVASEEDELSDLSDSEQKIQKHLKNAKNEIVEKPSSKPTRGRPASAKTHINAKKSKPAVAKSNQRQEDIEDDPPDSHEVAQIVEEPPNINAKRLRLKNQPANVEQNELESEPSKTARTKKGHIESATGDDNESQLIAEEVASEEDELLTDSLSHRISTRKLSVIATVAKKTDKIKNAKVTKKSKAAAAKSNQRQEDIEDDPPDSHEVAPIVEEPPNINAKRLRSKNQLANVKQNELESEPSKTARTKKRHIQSATGDDNESELPTKAQAKKKRLNAEEDVTDAAAEPVIDDNIHENHLEPSNKSRPKKRHIETDEAELPAKAPVKAKKRRVNVEENETETNGGDDSAISGNPVQSQADDNANEMQSSMKSKSRKPSKRKQKTGVRDESSQPNENDDNQTTGSNLSAATRGKKLGRWDYASSKITRYDSSKPRDFASGMRHSAREIRVPTNKIAQLFPTPRARTNRTNALRESKTGRTSSSNRNATLSKNRIEPAEFDNVYSMLLNGTLDAEPPVISRLRDIEITQGFHKTIKNNLVIHHIPGETGPSYGYFTMEPGMVKRSCRITWNLHIHVVSGPIVIISENEYETMPTGSFASLRSGTKYSLRNDGENASIVFFSQHLTDV